MPHPTKLTSLTFLSMIALGCNRGSELTEVLPDERIQVNLPIGEGLAKDEGKEWATYYLFTAYVTEHINGFVGGVLYWVDTITSEYPPTYVNRDLNNAVWGPWSGALDPVETQLWVTYDQSSDTYTWGFQQWPKEEDESSAYDVLLGEVDEGATHDVSSGRFSVDFDTIRELDPTETAAGQFDVDYDIREDGVTAYATSTGFGEGQDNDGTYYYDQSFGGDGMMDLVIISDLNPGGGAGLDETWYVRSRWVEWGEGRSDVEATGGDLGSEVYTLSECWSSSFERVYYVDNFSGLEEGDASLCVFDSAEYYED